MKTWLDLIPEIVLIISLMVICKYEFKSVWYPLKNTVKNISNFISRILKK